MVPVVDGFAAGLLLDDGRIAGINEDASTAATALSLDGVRMVAEVTRGSDAYVLIHHRSHLSVMMAATPRSAGCEVDYCADFRGDQSYGGCHQLRRAGGNFLMAAGEVNRSGGVSWRDDDLILSNPGPVSYVPQGANYPVDGNFNFDGPVSLADAQVIMDNNLLSSRECAPCP